MCMGVCLYKQNISNITDGVSRNGSCSDLCSIPVSCGYACVCMGVHAVSEGVCVCLQALVCVI